MKTMNYPYKMMLAALSVAAAWGMASCSEDIAVGDTQPGNRAITFTTSVEAPIDVTRAAANTEAQPIELTGANQKLWLVPMVETTAATEKTAATRGAQLGPSSDLGSFGISAFQHPTGDDIDSYSPDFFYDLEASEIGNTGVWQISEPYHWPASNESLTFQAYYPYDNANVVLTDKAATTKNTGGQSFTVQVAADVENQVDFMTASVADVSFKSSAQPQANLSFQHHMTAVRFVLGDQFVNGYIKSITLSGIYRRGTYTIGTGWTLDSNDKNQVGGNWWDANSGLCTKPVDISAQDKSITTASETFLLIPQTFGASATGDNPETAKITIVFNDGYDDYTVEASLAGQGAWVEGTTVTYAISSEFLTTLRVSTITYPSTNENAPKTTWAQGDQVGLYVVKNADNSIVYENVPVEYVGGSGHWKWQIHHPSGNTIFKLPGYSYYFYYPYNSTLPAGYPTTGHSANEAATEFFSGIIQQWGTNNNPKTSQGTLTNFNNADLQVATATDDSRLSTIQAEMARQMGLVIVTPGSKEVPKVTNYALTTDANFTWHINSTETIYAGAPDNLYGHTDGKYYYWIRPATDVQIVSSHATDPWQRTAHIDAANGVQNITPTSSRTSTSYNETAATADLTFTVNETTFHVIAVGGGNYSQHWTRYNEYDVSVSGTLTSFWMGQTEVTRGLWRAVMGGDKHQDGTALDAQAPAVTSGDANYPQARVSHIDIMGSDGAGTSSSCFIKKLNDAVASQLVAYGLSGRKFNLPSEAQWQWAAMGGLNTHNYTYAGGNDLNSVAWNSGNSNSQTHPVGQKTANELQLYDMTGNVWEWCRDWYCSSSTIVTSQGTDYCRTTQGDSSNRVDRGGGWYHGSDWCPVSRRGSSAPSDTSTGIGLRLLLQ